MSAIAIIKTIGDRYGGLIIVPGGSSLRTFVLFLTLLHSNKYSLLAVLIKEIKHCLYKQWIQIICLLFIKAGKPF